MHPGSFSSLSVPRSILGSLARRNRSTEPKDFSFFETRARPVARQNCQVRRDASPQWRAATWWKPCGSPSSHLISSTSPTTGTLTVLTYSCRYRDASTPQQQSAAAGGGSRPPHASSRALLLGGGSRPPQQQRALDPALPAPASSPPPPPPTSARVLAVRSRRLCSPRLRAQYTFVVSSAGVLLKTCDHVSLSCTTTLKAV